MKYRIAPIAAVVSAVLFLPSVAAEDEATQDHQKLVGAWEGWVVHGRGDNPNSGPIKLTEVVITSEKIRARQSGDRDLGEGTYRLDTAPKPRTLDTTGTAGEVRGQKFQGIYAFDGETLKWCASNPGRPRPGDFATRPGDGQFLMVLKRRSATSASSR